MANRKSTRLTVRVMHFASLGYWSAKCGDFESINPVKRYAVDAAVLLCRAIEASGGCASLRIHDKAGKFQEERTYPRSSDPRKSKG